MKKPTEKKLPQYLSALSTYKADLERLIAHEMKKRAPCTLTLQQLKKLRLKTKDRMIELQRRIERATAKAPASSQA